jgi:hypothetical protein
MDAARQLAGNDADAGFSRLVIAAWAGETGGLDRLLDACRGTPLDENRLFWCARVASYRGDPEAAVETRRLLEVLEPGLSSEAGLLRVEEPGEGTVSGNLARFWGTFTYRRATPVDLLVPSLVHLRLT